ncbi:MAG TPA: hypothetical protein VM802_27885 [Chitinophaga sp.]|uniref:hypothetical protein n=1 Tax=Chitinophaga sp. TaxID=1869181 RepID=UPI002BA40258|nr:hypothetical protein [Chitinophaga sp.]HVI48721.1 hypothetical protein [Chitinophaga sp.]
MTTDDQPYWLLNTVMTLNKEPGTVTRRGTPFHDLVPAPVLSTPGSLNVIDGIRMLSTAVILYRNAARDNN